MSQSGFASISEQAENKLTFFRVVKKFDDWKNLTLKQKLP